MQRGMLSAWTKRESDLNGVALGVTWTTSTLTVEGITNVEVNQKDILWPGVVDEGKNIFSTLLMLLLTMFIMRRFVKLSLTLGGWPIEEVMKNLTGLAEQFAKSAPILPWKTSFTAAKTFLSKNREKMLGWVGLNKEWQFGEMGEGGAFTTSEEKFSSLVNSKLWLGDPWMEKDNKELEGLAKNMEYNKYSTFFDRSKTLANEKDGWLPVVNNTRRMNSVKLFLSNSNFTQFNSTLTDDRKFTWPWTNQNPEDYFNFNNGQNAKALYEAMWGTAASWVGAPSSYNDLTKITFYATNATKQK